MLGTPDVPLDSFSVNARTHKQVGGSQVCIQQSGIAGGLCADAP
jgi:hypothetical protein